MRISDIGRGVYPWIAACVLVFVCQQLMPEWVILGSLWQPQNTLFYRHWQWLTHLFLHDGVLHLLLNMYVLYTFAPMVLQRIGAARFALLYVLSGVGGAAAFVLWNSKRLFDALVADSETGYRAAEMLLFQHVLGASGAVFGVLSAFALCFPNAPLRLLVLPMDFRAKYLLGAVLAYEVFAQASGVSLFGSGIAHLAHIGGAASGALLTWLMLRFGAKRRFY